jgi:glycosyltransferase involved in cell wall biosynthesis
MLVDTPAVSVVIATFNRVGFIGETIESVLCQKFQDFELIVVDDGSTDNTPELVRSFGYPIRYFRQANKGPSAARNLGVKQARAPWISIQDSDDVCASNHLEVLYSYARTHGDCGMVFANGAYLGGPEHNRETIIPKSKSLDLAERGIRLEDLFDKSIVRLQAALISKDCYETVGGHDETLRIAMDLDLAFRLYARYPIAYLDEVVFYYRKHQGNIGRDQELRLLENIRVIEKLVIEYPDARQQLGEHRIAQRIGYRYYRLAKGRKKRGDRRGAIEALQHAVAYHPFSLKYRAYRLFW